MPRRRALALLIVAPLLISAVACGSSTKKAGKAGASATPSGSGSVSATADPSASGSTADPQATGTLTPAQVASSQAAAAVASQRAVGVMSVPGKGTIAAQPYTPPAISWTSNGCANGFQCGNLVVPLDYANASGPTISVALIRHLATGARIGSAMVNFGGPGGSGVTLLPEFESSISSSITSRFDMISFDPRGVGKTDPVTCVTDAQMDAFFHADPEPTDQAGRDAYNTLSQQFAQGCANDDKTGLLAHVGTEEVARDMNSLREALGETTISYIGYSYGTYLGEIWADLFPSTVRAMIIDGAIDPDIDLAGLVDEQAKGFDSNLQLFFDDCANRSTCTWAKNSSTPADAYDALHAMVTATPVAAGDNRTVGVGELDLGVGQSMYVKAYWSQLDTALVDLGNGDGSAMLQLSDDYTDRDASGHYSNATEANIAVNCLDRTGPTSEQAWYSNAMSEKSAAPRLGFSIIYNTLPCTYMPAIPRAPHTVSATGSAPILVIGTLHDPATPYVWAQAVSKQLQNNVLLTLNSSGHLASFQGSSCIVNAENAYLVSLTLPAANTTCQLG